MKKPVKYTFKLIGDEEYPELTDNRDNPYSGLPEDVRMEYLIENFARALKDKRKKPEIN